VIKGALDEASSSTRRFSDGRIYAIDQHVFRYDAIKGSNAFKIENLRVSPTFVSNRFVDAWYAAGLRGLEFDQVWEPPRR
jgi:hypothetical protein